MREHKVDNYIGGAGKWEERSGAHHVFLRLQPRKAGQSWWVDIKVAANAEVVAVVEDTDIIIHSFIKVMDISPSVKILVAILALSEKPNALSAMAHLNNIRIIVAGRLQLCRGDRPIHRGNSCKAGRKLLQPASPAALWTTLLPSRLQKGLMTAN